MGIENPARSSNDDVEDDMTGRWKTDELRVSKYVAGICVGGKATSTTMFASWLETLVLSPDRS
jgi:hypothetical protein